jgi:serine protease inhibitor
MRRQFLLGSLALLACTTVGVDDAQPPVSKSDAKPEPEPSQDPEPQVPVDPQPVDADTATAMANGLNAFSLEFYAQVRSTPGNSVMSPASIAMALSLVHAGAKGDTEREITKALHLGASADASQNAMGSLLARWNGKHESFELAVANRIFGEKTVTYEKEYLGEVERLFAAPLESMDFKGGPDKARKRINEWVEKQTKDKIKDLLPNGSITAATRLALVNAVYFKSQWMFPFEDNRTRDGEFHLAKGKTATAKMMRQTSYFDHAEYADDGVAALQMPYEGREFAMVVLLPTKKDGLATLEGKLDATHYDKWIAGLQGKRVEVQLPRFEIEPPEAVLLSGPLKSMVRQRQGRPHRHRAGEGTALHRRGLSQGVHQGRRERHRGGCCDGDGGRRGRRSADGSAAELHRGSPVRVSDPRRENRRDPLHRSRRESEPRRVRSRSSWNYDACTSWGRRAAESARSGVPSRGPRDGRTSTPTTSTGSPRIRRSWSSGRPPRGWSACSPWPRRAMRGCSAVRSTAGATR